MKKQKVIWHNGIEDGYIINQDKKTLKIRWETGLTTVAQ
jgi:hypothetical protein